MKKQQVEKLAEAHRLLTLAARGGSKRLPTSAERSALAQATGIIGELVRAASNGAKLTEE